MQVDKGLKFNKTEYIDYSKQANKGCLQILPKKDYKAKTFVVGTEEGKIIHYKPLNGYLHGEPLKVKLNNPIKSVEIGSWGKDFRDRIFFTDGIKIAAQTKRSKQVFQKSLQQMNMNYRTDKIWAEDHYIWTQSQIEINQSFSKQFNNQTEKQAYYEAKNFQVNDFSIINPQKGQYYPILCSSDNKIRFINQSISVHEEELEAQPIISNIEFRTPWVNKANLYDNVYIGLENGHILNYKSGLELGFKKTWEFKPEENIKLNKFKLYDITKKGIPDLMLAYNDQSLAYYSQNINNEFELLWSNSYNLKPLDIEGGEISDVAYSEFIISTEEGKIFGLGEKTKRQLKNTGEKKVKKLVKGSQGTQNDNNINNQANNNISQQQDLKNKLDSQQNLENINLQDISSTKQKEIADVKSHLDEIQEKLKKIEKKQEFQDETKINLNEKKNSSSLYQDYQNNFTQSQSQNEQKDQGNKFENLANLLNQQSDIEGKQNKLQKNQPWRVQYELSANQEDGSLELLLICEHPLKMIMINSEIKDVQFENPDNNIAKMTQNYTINQNNNAVFTILKEDVFEYKIKMYVIEGIQGILKEKVSEEFLRNSLTVQGQNLQNSDIYFWLNNFISGLEIQDEQNLDGLSFENPFKQSFFRIKMLDNGCTFYSDSITTIHALKDLITEDSNMRGKQVDIKWDIDSKSLKRNLKFLRNKIRENKRVLDQQALLEGIEDLKQNEQNLDFLSDELQQIYNQRVQIQEQIKNLPKNLDYLKKLVIQLYCNYSKLKGNYGFEQNIEKLSILLDKYKYKQIFELMNVSE
ncbi:hypothetical protein PPERSA_04981 [Pseudocohnilembus persalinus]|uniref:Uncharacterized protein n=1 Tax=Pseudocohnilembus persalinus TaxID=266149 RepID=A0A0V0QWI5_PSEPJ|nr:hypothetical protein PPERSA_04981 [Pseudocohnilembus persalinus]|eukprot:KRX06368.1 hypothetical protein PPERSA_04981 [Pseudocohnilembus persalinus]